MRVMVLVRVGKSLTAALATVGLVRARGVEVRVDAIFYARGVHLKLHEATLLRNCAERNG